MQKRIRIALLATVAALAVASSAMAANAKATRWYWNKQAAQYALLVQGLEYADDTMDVEDARCNGVGPSIWGNKGKMFSTFWCTVSGTYEIGGEWDTYNITVYVNGKNAWRFKTGLH